MVYPTRVTPVRGGMSVTRETIPPLRLLASMIADMLVEDQ